MTVLQLMEIEWHCRRLAYAFSYHLDTRNYEGLAALFAEDGVWERHGEVLRGQDRIIEVMNTRPASQFTRHVITNFHFHEMTETTARATLYNLSWFSFEADTLPSVFNPENALLLDFNDRYRLTADGWKFAERTMSPIFKAPSLMNR